MSRSNPTSAPSRQEPTATRSLIGIDAEGSRHHWLHGRDSVRVERPDGSVDHYGIESVSAWTDRVERQCGWTRCHARESTVELLVDSQPAHLCLSCDEAVDHRTWSDHVDAGHRVTLAPHMVFDR